MAVVADVSKLDWETWPEDELAERGRVRWKTLVSADRTPSDTLTLGIALVPPGEMLHLHRHEQPEIYVALEGAGEVTIDGETFAMSPGIALFIPGNALHGCSNRGPDDLRFVYVFAADSFADVEYVFGQ
jgi:mannose-6-phosphate isomerase-like protein (cupin superfamily)